MTSLAAALLAAACAWGAFNAAVPGFPGLSAAVIVGAALGFWSLWRSRGRRRP